MQERRRYVRLNIPLEVSYSGSILKIEGSTIFLERYLANGIDKEIVTIPNPLSNLSYFLFAEIKMPITKRLKAIAVITNNRSNTVRLKISPNSLLYK